MNVFMLKNSGKEKGKLSIFWNIMFFTKNLIYNIDEYQIREKKFPVRKQACFSFYFLKLILFLFKQ